MRITAATSWIIVRKVGADALERLAACELKRYLEKLTGTLPPIIEWDGISVLPEQPLIMIGDTEGVKGLGEDGYIIERREFKDQPGLVLAGRRSIGSLYAVYHFLEMLGVTFFLTGDLLPEPVERLAMPDVNASFEPAFMRRGLFYGLHNLHSTILGLDDYKKMIDQMVKLRLNHLTFSCCHGEPWVEYTFRGQKNLLGDLNSCTTGYLSTKLNAPDGRTSLVKIGREHFAGRTLMAPPELQDVKDQKEAHMHFSQMMKAVFAYAKTRGIKVGLAVEPMHMVPNLARFARQHSHRKAGWISSVYGVPGSFSDPVLVEIAQTVVRAILSTYLEIDEFFVFNAEVPDICRHPDSVKVYEKMRPCFETARQTVEAKWQSRLKKHNITAGALVDSDIGMLEVTRRVIEMTRKMRPGLKVGMGFLFRGYLLPCVDKILDRSIPFMDFQSSGVFPVTGDTNAEYFSGMGERERIIIPRIDDDGTMFGPSFYLRQFQRDGFFKHVHEAGVSGFSGQIFRQRGTEHHTRFLALGAWEPQLTPKIFYERFCREVFGPSAAEPMHKAFELLETCDEKLGWRGSMNFSWAHGSHELKFMADQLMMQADPLQAPPGAEELVEKAKRRAGLFEQAVNLMGQALSHMERSQSVVSSKGKSYLAYLMSKICAYRTHLEMLVKVDEGLACYCRAYLDYQADNTLRQKTLEQAYEIFLAASNKAHDATKRVAEVIDHPNDLAILFLSNYWNLGQMEKLLAFVRRMVDYYNGLPYWLDTEGKKNTGSNQGFDWV